jgi:short-subunit dehydrogenase
MEFMNDNKKRALITGASGGLGLQFAHLLAKEGYDLVLASRNGSRLKSIAAELEKKYGIKAISIIADLSIIGGAKKLYNQCRKNKLKISLLVNNAGRGMVGSCTDQDCDDIEQLAVLNSITPMTLSTLFAQDMTVRGSGHILNVGSVVGLQPIPYFASYAASKSFFHSYSISMHYELKSKGVNVTCVIPGFMATDFDEGAGITNKTYLKISNSSAMDPRKVAEIGLDALFKGKCVVVAGLPNKAANFFSYITPKRLTAWLLEKTLRNLV